jgi:hypothetical protein
VHAMGVASAGDFPGYVEGRLGHRFHRQYDKSSKRP